MPEGDNTFQGENIPGNWQRFVFKLGTPAENGYFDFFNRFNVKG